MAYLYIVKTLKFKGKKRKKIALLQGLGQGKM